MRQRSVMEWFFARVLRIIPVACLGLATTGCCSTDFTPPSCPPLQPPPTETIVRGGVELFPGQRMDSRRRDRSIEKLRASGYFDSERTENVTPPALPESP